MTAVEVLQQVRSLGVSLEVEGGSLRLRPRSALTPELVGALREHKPEVLQILRSGGWPVECLEAERRFGQFHARLFPWLDKLVETPMGRGRLLQVFAERVAVSLDGSQGTLTFLLPEEIRPLGVPAVEVDWRNRWAH